MLGKGQVLGICNQFWLLADDLQGGRGAHRLVLQIFSDLLVKNLVNDLGISWS